MRRFAICIACVAAAGCNTVVMNDGNTVVIDWDQSMTTRQQALDTATTSCKEAGKQSAVEMADVSVNPSLPAWMVKRRLTYRCQ